MSLRPRVAGVDFSGARDAGHHIWVAEGTPTVEGLQIDTLSRAADLPLGGVGFTEAITGLRNHLEGMTDTIIGLDFPFSIPAVLIEQVTWPAFIRDFSSRFETAENFRDHCRSKTGGKELKRLSDVEARVPWCAYNLRIYRQTWAGIRHVLSPLVADKCVRVVPIQTPKYGLPIIAEVCPASLLKSEDLYVRYKGRGLELRKARSMILSKMTQRELLLPITGAIRKSMVEDIGGDALDAALAAVCASGIVDISPRSAADRLECRVYF